MQNTDYSTKNYMDLKLSEYGLFNKELWGKKLSECGLFHKDLQGFEAIRKQIIPQGKQRFCETAEYGISTRSLKYQNVDQLLIRQGSLSVSDYQNMDRQKELDTGGLFPLCSQLRVMLSVRRFRPYRLKFKFTYLAFDGQHRCQNRESAMKLDVTVNEIL